MIDTSRLARISGESGKEAIQIQRQIVLPWSEAFRISIRNVTLRLGRALITGAGVVLGIAFLTSVVTSKVVQDGLSASQAAQVQSLAAATAGAIGGEETEAEGIAADVEEESGRQARQIWLVIMSLLVCGVGITNSMLMSVTERFQEIGTMKCLGALDTFIVRLFLIEAALVGILGSVLGLLLGHLGMLLIFCIKDGFSVPAKMNWLTMLGYLGIALAIGTIISLVAAVPPAVRAARMAPAVALQTEI